MYGPQDIPSVGSVELSWVTEPAPAHASTPSGSLSAAQSPSVPASATVYNHPAIAHNTDVPMAMNDEVYVDYDVAEDNGDWDID